MGEAFTVHLEALGLVALASQRLDRGGLLLDQGKLVVEGHRVLLIYSLFAQTARFTLGATVWRSRIVDNICGLLCRNS